MFNTSDIKDLREKTGAGMLDCKKALTENDGNMEKAIDWLREKGISKALKKEGRIAAEGICAIKVLNNTAIILEVNTETDFVAKNEEFKEFINYLVDKSLTNNVSTVEDVLNIMDGEETISLKLVHLVAKIGEKISFRRFERVIKDDNQTFGSYIHMGGKIGALVVLSNGTDEVAKDVAMQVAAMNPTCVKREDILPEMLERERNVIKEQVLNEGKPEAIALKMVEGRLNKFYKEACLNEQEFFKEPGLSMQDYVKNNNGTILKMIRYAVGEGIEKRQDDFASEVMSQINSANK